MILALIKVHKKTAPRQMVVPRERTDDAPTVFHESEAGNLWAELDHHKGGPNGKDVPEKEAQPAIGARVLNEDPGKIQKAGAVDDADQEDDYLPRSDSIVFHVPTPR